MQFFGWVQYIGKNAVVFIEFHDPESPVCSAPVATEVSIKDEGHIIFYFDIVLIMVMAVKYCLYVLMSRQQLKEFRTIYCILSLLSGVDMNKDENVIHFPVLFQLFSEPVKIVTEIGPCFNGSSSDQDRVFIQFEIDVHWHVPYFIPLCCRYMVMIALADVINRGQFIQRPLCGRKK